MDRSHPSRLQNDVVNELTSMGFHPQEEMILSCSGYRLDACVLVHGKKVLGFKTYWSYNSQEASSEKHR